MSIEFQYFNGCPNATETLANVKSVIAELNIPLDQLEIVEVPDMDTAKRLNFQGSPSILINRKDIYSEYESGTFSYACRLYNFGGVQSGVIPREFIKEKLRNLSSIESEAVSLV